MWVVTREGSEDHWRAAPAAGASGGKGPSYAGGTCGGNGHVLKTWTPTIGRIIAGAIEPQRSSPRKTPTLVVDVLPPPLPPLPAGWSTSAGSSLPRSASALSFRAGLTTTTTAADDTKTSQTTTPGTSPAGPMLSPSTDREVVEKSPSSGRAATLKPISPPEVPRGLWIRPIPLPNTTDSGPIGHGVRFSDTPTFVVVDAPAPAPLSPFSPNEEELYEKVSERPQPPSVWPPPPPPSPPSTPRAESKYDLPPPKPAKRLSNSVTLVVKAALNARGQTPRLNGDTLLKDILLGSFAASGENDDDPNYDTAHRREDGLAELTSEMEQAFTQMLDSLSFKTVGQLAQGLNAQTCRDMISSHVRGGDGNPYVLAFITRLSRLRDKYLLEHLGDLTATPKLALAAPQTIVRSFPGHFHPEKDCEYFLHDPGLPQDGTMIELSTVVPFFNEEGEDLKRTLRSLFKQQRDLKLLGIRNHVLLISDGWWKASKSMRRYLQSIFHNCPFGKQIRRPGPDPGKDIETFVIQSAIALDEKRIELAPIEFEPGQHLLCSLLVKRENRKKHNSHDWYLRSFAPFYKSELLFLTDCGTTYDRHTLFQLIKEMLAHPDWTAVTGRPRLMSATEQGWQSNGLLKRLTRAAQAYDYESTTASFTAAFSLFGLLPVIPGPCGLFRYNAIKTAIDEYIKTVDKKPEETDLVLGSLLLAEDRVLSAFGALLAENTANPGTAFVPEAVFYFEAETDSERLLGQRRRWINGTVAGYIWLAQNLHYIWNSKMSLVSRIVNIILVYCQIGMCVAVTLAPAFFSLLFYFSLSSRIWGQHSLRPVRPTFTERPWSRSSLTMDVCAVVSVLGGCCISTSVCGVGGETPSVGRQTEAGLLALRISGVDQCTAEHLVRGVVGTRNVRQWRTDTCTLAVTVRDGVSVRFGTAEHATLVLYDAVDVYPVPALSADVYRVLGVILVCSIARSDLGKSPHNRKYARSRGCRQ
jgi:cellulose synthase/poly-beta-1,6-N-acetylglucosamine synthase-like glycosyltransferase